MTPKTDWPQRILSAISEAHDHRRSALAGGLATGNWSPLARRASTGSLETRTSAKCAGLWLARRRLQAKKG